MKSSISLILAAVLVLSLCGCSAPAQSSEPASSGSENNRFPPLSSGTDLAVPSIPDQTQLSGSAEIPEDWVFTNYQECFSWKDSLGNICQSDITLPALVPAAEFAVEFNQEIQSLGQRILEDVRSSARDGYSSSVLSVNYRIWNNNPVISLLLTIHHSSGETEYQVWNFDLEAQESLSVADLCLRALDISYPVFLLSADKLAETAFRNRYGSVLAHEETDPANENTVFLEEYSRILGNIPFDTLTRLSYQLFLGEDGQPMLIYPAPELAEPYGYDHHIATITEFDLESIDREQSPTAAQAYHELFSLTFQVDGNALSGCAQLLQLTFFSESLLFLEYVAQEPASTQETVRTLLTTSLTEESARQMAGVCRHILAGDALLPAAQTFIESLLVLL